MIRDALLISGKDLRIERQSKLVFSQIVPFGIIMLLLFGLAVEPTQRVEGSSLGVLQSVAPGLLWTAVLFSSLFALGRSFDLETQNKSLDALRMTGVDPAAIFLGKALAVIVQVFALEVVLGLVAYVVYGIDAVAWDLFLATAVGTTATIAVAGTLYTTITIGSRFSNSLLALVFMPAMAPVMVAATEASRVSFSSGLDSNGWGWALLLGALAVLYTGLGMLAFDALMEDS